MCWQGPCTSILTIFSWSAPKALDWSSEAKTQGTDASDPRGTCRLFQGWKWRMELGERLECDDMMKVRLYFCPVHTTQIHVRAWGWWVMCPDSPLQRTSSQWKAFTGSLIYTDTHTHNTCLFLLTFNFVLRSNLIYARHDVKNSPCT